MTHEPAPRRSRRAELRRAATIALAMIGMSALAMIGCGAPPRPARAHAAAPAGATAPAAERRVEPGSRSTLAAYLDMTFSGRHERAWSLLTREDQASLSRGSYVQQEAGNDRLRAQVRALGPIRYRIASLSERRTRADAVVAVTSGLGSQRVRFVLRREREHWRVDYAHSWSDE